MDFQRVRQQLQTHKHLTLQLLWEEYREAHPGVQLLEIVPTRERKLDVVLRQEYRAGEKTFVDWAGDKVPVYDYRTGESYRASMFVAVLGASSYTFAPRRRTRRCPVGSIAMSVPLNFFREQPVRGSR